MSLMAPIFFAFLIIFAAFPSNASMNYKAQATPILDALVEKNIRKVGDLDLIKLRRQIIQVQWKDGESPASESIVGNRRSAYYNSSKKRVTFLNADGSAADYEMALFSLHESMGALGYNDKTYNLSIALSHLNKIDDPELRQKVLKVYGSQLFNVVSLGGSSVGGGGDLVSIILKSRILDEISRTEKPDPEFFAKFAAIEIEPDSRVLNPEDETMYLRYYIKRVPILKRVSGFESDISFKVQERILINISNNLWTSETIPQKAIEILKRRIIEIYLLPPIEVQDCQFERNPRPDLSQGWGREKYQQWMNLKIRIKRAMFGLNCMTKDDLTHDLVIYRMRVDQDAPKVKSTNDNT